MNISAYQQKQKIRREAEAFVIWREGSSVDWDCTLTELSEATGLSYNRVKLTVKVRGWPVTYHQGGRPRGQSLDLDKVLARSTGRGESGPASKGQPLTTRMNQIMQEIKNEKSQTLAVAE